MNDYASFQLTPLFHNAQNTTLIVELSILQVNILDGYGCCTVILQKDHNGQLFAFGYPEGQDFLSRNPKLQVSKGSSLSSVGKP